MSAQKRGRETALDMLRTLAVVFALVVPMWFFGRSSPSDEQRIRPVDPSGAYVAFAQDTGGPVVTRTPDGWTPTVRDLATSPGVVRVGYVHGDHYLEFLGSKGTDFLDEATGKATEVGTVTVGSVQWRDYRDDAGAQSLVLTRAGVTVVIGGVRETASQAELVELAALVR
jgi:hypothetical protein